MAYSKKDFSVQAGYKTATPRPISIQYANDLVARAKKGNGEAAYEIFTILKNTPYTAEVLPAKATTTIGAGDNGVVTITRDNYGAEGNSWTVKVEVPDAANGSLAATLSGKDITVTLGTDAGKAADATKNTATLIATAVAALDGVGAAASGTGATAISAAVAKKNFTGGTDGVCDENTRARAILNDFYTNGGLYE